MRMSSMRRMLVAAVVGGASLIPSIAINARQPLSSFLHDVMGLDAGALNDVEHGKSVIRRVRTAKDHDIVLFGVIAVDVPRAFYVDRMKNASRSGRAIAAARASAFSAPHPPRPISDSSRSHPEDLDLLRACKPGACDFKLPADMARVRAMLDARDAGLGRVMEYAKGRMAEYVNDYRARGGSTLLVYGDEANGRGHADAAFAALLTQSPHAYGYTPAFYQYLLDYPASPLDGVTNMIYWARDEAAGMRPTFTINHIVFFSPPEWPDATLVATKQLFADHYFEAAVAQDAVVDRPTPGNRPGVYVLWLRQYRFDNLPSGGLFNLRGRVVGKLQDWVEAQLRRTKSDYEQAFTKARARGRSRPAGDPTRCSDDALSMREYPFPRTVRSALSNPNRASLRRRKHT